jgi:hypothetical protein
MTALAFLAAVAAMLANGAASLMEALGSRRAAGGRPTWRQPRYLAGIGGLGRLLSVTALRVLPVVAVQSVLAAALVVLAVLAPGSAGTVLLAGGCTGARSAPWWGCCR